MFNGEGDILPGHFRARPDLLVRGRIYEVVSIVASEMSKNYRTINIKSLSRLCPYPFSIYESFLSEEGFVFQLCTSLS